MNKVEWRRLVSHSVGADGYWKDIWDRLGGPPSARQMRWWAGHWKTSICGVMSIPTVDQSLETPRHHDVTWDG